MIKSGVTTKEVVDTIQLNMDPEEAVNLLNALIDISNRELLVLLAEEEADSVTKAIRVLSAAIKETPDE